MGCSFRSPLLLPIEQRYFPAYHRPRARPTQVFRQFPICVCCFCKESAAKWPQVLDPTHPAFWLAARVMPDFPIHYANKTSTWGQMVRPKLVSRPVCMAFVGWVERSETHVWTAPASQGLLTAETGLVDCVHVSGLGVRLC